MTVRHTDGPCTKAARRLRSRCLPKEARPSLRALQAAIDRCVLSAPARHGARGDAASPFAPVCSDEGDIAAAKAAVANYANWRLPDEDRWKVSRGPKVDVARGELCRQVAVILRRQGLPLTKTPPSDCYETPGSVFFRTLAAVLRALDPKKKHTNLQRQMKDAVEQIEVVGDASLPTDWDTLPLAPRQ